MKYLSVFLLLVGCASVPKSAHEYQDRFILGCMNAYLNFTATPKHAPMNEAGEWCTARFIEVKKLSEYSSK